MRVLLVVPPSRARLHTLVPLGWALRTGGHDTQVGGPAGFAGEITGTGFVAAGESGVDDYAPRWRPDLVVWDALTSGAGLAPADVRVLGPYDEVAEADGSLDLLPELLRPGGIPLRYQPYGGPSEVPGWLRRRVRRRRVFVTDAVPGPAVAGLCEAVAGMDVELVCAARIPEGTRIPSNVRVFEQVPAHPVLATCTSVVHDGEPGLALAAAARGLPQLAVGGGWLAARIAGAGAGLVADTVDKAVLDSLVNDPVHAGGAARLGAEIAAMPTPRAVAADLGSYGRT